jgi:hypothetical protein
MDDQAPTPLPDYSDAVKVLDEALTELQIVEDVDQAWSLLDYLAQRGWDIVRRGSSRKIRYQTDCERIPRGPPVPQPAGLLLCSTERSLGLPGRIL